jgi:hypothetical protein
MESDNGDKIELYNLSNDIKEKNDVSLDHPELVNEMWGKLELWKMEVSKGVNVVSK